MRRVEWTPRDVAVGAGARLSLGRVHLCLAAEAGHLEVLKWAREHHCPWDEFTCTCESAASNGHLETLQWVREHHCPWDSGTRAAAVAAGQSEVIRWLDENGAP
jgi:hypothetical protein